MPEHVEQVADWIAAAEHVTVLTGAGISTDSGIPDFRGPQGVWTKNPAAEKTATLEHYLASSEVRRQSWKNRLTASYWEAEPNPGHRALVELERQERLVALVTQNIDELHQRAGSSPALVVELHGSAFGWVCWSCGATGPMAEMLDRVRAGEEEPDCSECHGIVKSTTISFGQNLDPDVRDRASWAAATCDLLLAVGSSLGVYPAAGLVPLAVRAGARLVIVNGEETPFDDLADAVVRESISDALPLLVTRS